MPLVSTLLDGGSSPLFSCCAHSNPLLHSSHYSSFWTSHSCSSLLHDSNKLRSVAWMSTSTRPVVYLVWSQHSLLGTMPWQVLQKHPTGINFIPSIAFPDRLCNKILTSHIASLQFPSCTSHGLRRLRTSANPPMLQCQLPRYVIKDDDNLQRFPTVSCLYQSLFVFLFFPLIQSYTSCILSLASVAYRNRIYVCCWNNYLHLYNVPTVINVSSYIHVPNFNILIRPISSR